MLNREINTCLKHFTILSIVSLLILSAFTVPANAEVKSDSLGLEECLELGIERNLNLKRLSLEKSLDVPSVLSGIGLFLPNLTVGYSIDQSSTHNRTYINPDGTVTILPAEVEGRLMDATKTERRGSQYSVRSELVLYDGLRNIMTFQNALLTRNIRDTQIQNEITNLKLAITTSFVNLTSAIKKKELSYEVIQQRTTQLEFAKARFDAGMVTKRDVLVAEVNLGRSRLDSINAEVELNRSRENLNLVLGVPIDTVLNVRRLHPEDFPEVDREDLLQFASLNRADLSLSELNLKITSNNLRSAWGEFHPRLSANVTHFRNEQSGTNVDFTLDPRNHSTTVGLTLSYPLFDRFTRVLKTQDAKVKYNQGLISAEELKRNIKREVLVAIDKIQALYLQLDLARKNLELANDILEFEQERYRIGTISIIDLGSAQVNYIEAANEFIRLEGLYFIVLSELDRAVGGSHWR